MLFPALPDCVLWWRDSGRQLATGTTLTEPQPFGPPRSQNIDPDPFAAVAGLCVIAGLVLSLIGRRLARATAISGAVGAMALLIMRSRLDDELQKQTQGLAKATSQMGFMFEVALLVAAAALNGYLMMQEKRTAAAVSKVPKNARYADGGARPG